MVAVDIRILILKILVSENGNVLSAVHITSVMAMLQKNILKIGLSLRMTA